jgi:hypothetical protein
MNKKYKNWLEEVWEIKEKIARETKNMEFKEYWKYIDEHAEKAKKELQSIIKSQGMKKS